MWIQTFTGKRFQPLIPDINLIDIQDIAHALSLQCRFAGHCKFHYSVAYHSILVSQLLERWFPGDKTIQLWGLLHDASEAYLCDIPRPIKHALGGYQEYEDAIMKLVADKYLLPYEMPESVHKADMILCATEMPVLLGKEAAPWNLPYDPDPEIRIQKLDPEDVENAFLLRFLDLKI